MSSWCDADIQDAVAPIGHEINPAPDILRLKQGVDGRNKSGNDGVVNAEGSPRGTRLLH